MGKVTDPDEWGYCRKSGDYIRKGDHDRECSNKCDIVTSKSDVDGKCRDGGCYITTATCVVYGMNDDCEVLNRLRDFRDTYMTDTQERRELLKLYYETAPNIVETINRHPYSTKIYQKMMKEYILPAVKQIKKGYTEKAFHIYKEGVMFAMNIVNN